MVQLEPGHSNAGLLKIAGDLAERFDARVIGIVACREMQLVYGDGYIPAELFDQDRGQLEKKIKEAEAEFRSMLQTRVRTLEWRSGIMFTPLSEYIGPEVAKR
jgi:hypothetical protein